MSSACEESEELTPPILPTISIVFWNSKDGRLQHDIMVWSPSADGSYFPAPSGSGTSRGVVQANVQMTFMGSGMTCCKRAIRVGGLDKEGDTTVARGSNSADSPFCVSLPVPSMSIHNVEVPVAVFWLSRC